MITLRRLLDNQLESSVEVRDLDVACSLLCFRLPVDLHYGKFSLMTCVDVVPRDMLGYMYPDSGVLPLDNGSEYAFVFKSVASNGSPPRVLDSDLTSTIRVITQSRRTRGCRPCRDCSRYDNCILMR